MKYLSQWIHRASTLLRTSSAIDTTVGYVVLQQVRLAQQTRSACRTVSDITKYLRQRRVVIAAISISLLCSALPFTATYAKHNSLHPLTNEEWQEVMEKVSLLDEAVLIPSLLPIIMTNRDALGLSEEQFERLHRWRKEHYVNMVNIMNEVIEKRVRFRVESLSPTVSDAHLIAFQEEIQRLERELLKVRLSCRDIVMETFTHEQWETLEFLVADDPKLGSLISQRHGIRLVHHH